MYLHDAVNKLYHTIHIIGKLTALNYIKERFTKTSAIFRETVLK